MITISDVMTRDHRCCDELFTDTENAVHDEGWSLPDLETSSFLAAMEKNFEVEERILFPALFSQPHY
jgi:hypothetical protein